MSRKMLFVTDLDLILRRFEGPEIKVEDILEGLDYRSHALLIFLLSIPFVLPVPIMGLSTIFGSVMMVSAFSIITHRNPWLPKKIRHKTLPRETLQNMARRAEKLSARLERWVRPRYLFFSRSPFWVRIHGVMILIAAMILALPSPPGGNVLPGAATLVLSLGLVEEDGLVLAVGYVLTALNVFLLTLILVYGLDWLMSFFRSFV